MTFDNHSIEGHVVQITRKECRFTDIAVSGKFTDIVILQVAGGGYQRRHRRMEPGWKDLTKQKFTVVEVDIVDGLVRRTEDKAEAVVRG